MLCCVSKRAVDGDYGPPYENRTHTDQLPVLLEKIEIELYPEEDVPSILLPCAICARTFMPQSLEKHKKICEKAALKKRKPFDSAKQRIQGTELADFLPKQEKKRQDDSKPNKSAWKQTHNEFLRTIRAARGESVDSTAQRQGSSQITTGAPSRGTEQGTCPTCSRHFGIKAYDRHVAWCKERSTRLPTNPATNLAKERFEARMKYRAPGLKSRRPTNREKYSPGSAVTLNVNNNNNNVNKSPPQQVKAKESVSLPNCNKSNDGIVKQMPLVTNRRFAQREALNSSGPMKSRVADRTNRQTKISTLSKQTPRTPNSSHPSSATNSTAHCSTNGIKSKRNSATSELLKMNVPRLLIPVKMKTRKTEGLKIQSSHNEMKSPRTKDESKCQATASAMSQKMNIVSARSQGHPKINGVAINRELKSMTVQPCVIHKEEELVTWKQINRERCRQIRDEEDVSTLEYLKDFRLPNIDDHRNDDMNNENMCVEISDFAKPQYLDAKMCKEQKFKSDDCRENDYNLKVTERKKSNSGEKFSTGKNAEICYLYEQQEAELKDSTIKSANAENSEIISDDDVKLDKWAHVTQRLDQTYLITDSKAENSSFKNGSPLTTNRKLALITISPRAEFCLNQPINTNTNRNFDLNPPTILKVGKNDFLTDFSICSKTNSARSRKRSENNYSDDKVDMIHLINEDTPKRPINTKYLNEESSLDTRSHTLSESFDNQDDFIINEQNCNDNEDAEDFTRVSTVIHSNEPFEMVNISPVRSSTPFEILSEHNSSAQCNSTRSSTCSVAEKATFSPNFQQNNDESKLVNECSYETIVGKNQNASPHPKELPETIENEYDNETFLKMWKTWAVQEGPDQPSKEFNNLHSENIQDPVYSNKSTWFHQDSSIAPICHLGISGTTVKFANDTADVTKTNNDHEIDEKYVNKNFDYNCDAAPEHVVCHFKSIVETDSVTPMKSSLKRTVSSRSSGKQNVSDSHVQLSSRSLGKIVEHESSRDENRFTVDEMHRKVRRTMHLLRDSTDTLISSVEAPRLDNYKHANVINVVQVGRVEEIDKKTKSIVFGSLPEICNESKEIRSRATEGKTDASTMTYWEKVSNVKKDILINFDPPQREKYRLLKRNPKIHILPPVPSNATMRKRSGSNDYDPFILAEQQMSELLSDTSDQSDLTTSTHTNKNNLFPLTHSSAFVKYPFEFANNKRSSLIAPPTEFDDLTSDFSSDSTETNSLSREIFLGDLRNSTESTFSELIEKTNDKKVSPVKELGRRAIIDKSKALGNDTVESTVVRGNKSFVGSGDRARKIFDKVTPKVSPKVVRSVANRSHSLRASSAPKSTPERKSNTYGSTLSCSRRPTNYQINQSNQPDKKCSIKTHDERSYGPLSGSNLSLNSIISSPEIDVKRSNSAFDELMTSFEDDRASLFPSLKSFLKDDSLSVPSPSPTIDGQHRNGNSDEELSSPDSYKRQEHGKLSADSAYSSLNRKYSNHGRSTNDVGRLEENGLRKNRRATINGEAKYKMSKFCHECGMRFPETAKFCCECGVKRLAL